MTKTIRFHIPDSTTAAVVSVVGYTRFGGALRRLTATGLTANCASALVGRLLVGAAGSEVAIGALTFHGTNSRQTVQGTWTKDETVNVAAGSRLVAEITSTGTANASWTGIAVECDLDDPKNVADLS